MKKLDISKKKTGVFQGKKYLIFNKATRWPLLLGLLLVIIAGSAFAPGGSKPGASTTGRKAKPVSTKPLSAPTVSYTGPHSYTQGQTISLAPTSSGVGTFGFSTTATPYGSGYTEPLGLGTDAAGNVYIGDRIAGIIKIPPGNGSPVYVGGANYGITGIAVDAAGDVFASTFFYYSPVDGGDGYSSEGIVEFPAGGKPPIGIDGGGDSESLAVTVDLAGNAYIEHDYYYGDDYSDFLYTLEELPAGSTKLTQIYPDQNFLVGAMACDAGGDLFLTLGGTLELPANHGTPIPIGTSFAYVAGTTFDAAGNFFVVSNPGGPGLLQMVPAGNLSAPPVTIGPQFSSASAIAVDGAGNIYVSTDYGNSTTNQVSQVKPTGGYFITPALPAGLHFDNNTGIISGAATVASPATTYTITAYNGASSTTATVSIKIAQGSSNADLTHLIPTRGVLSPQFAAATTSYTAAVAYGVRSFQLTPISAAPNASITINGTAIADSATTAPLALAPGANNFNIVVTAPDQVTTKTYSLTVNRPVSNNADLSSMTRSAGVISPVFTAATTSYVTTVTNGVRTMTVTPTASDPDATIKVNGTTVVSGTASAPVTLPVGSTTINIAVTATDGTTTKTYSLTVNRPAASYDNLSALTLNTGILSPNFVPSATAYTVTVPKLQSSITVTPTAADPDATIKVNGQNVVSGTSSAVIAVPDGLSTINIVITASDGVTSKTYTITVNRPATNNDNLSALTTSIGTLSPALVAGTTIYTVTGINGTQLVTVTPTAADTGATIRVNGSVVASGTASASIPFTQGLSISITVTSSDGTATQTYTLTGRETPNSNADLADIRLSNGNLSPAFTASTTSYTVGGLEPTGGIIIGPDVADPGATVTLNGQSVPPRAAIRVPLNVGSNTAYIVVTASDGVTTKTYTLNITQPASNVANLLGLSISNSSLSPAFNSATTSYTASVIHGVASVVVRPVTTAIASITVNGTAVPSGGASGSIALNVGANVITVVVTAQDGVTQQTYTVTVTRAPSANANLTSLKFKAGVLNPVFSGTMYNYTANVAAGVSTDVVTPTTTDPGATVTVNGTAVASGTASGSIALAPGNNTITTVVTAQDGVTTNTYTVVITRAASPVNIPDESLSVTNPVEKPTFEDDIIIVHQGISPNGDGINDFLVIDGIQAYPDNKLTIMNRNGQLVFEAKGYDNASKIFDGHSNKTGQMQLPGTYFYSLDYTVKGVAKHKTGFIVLKY